MISSTVRPDGQAAIDVVTWPAVVIAGGAQCSIWRQVALSAGMPGPSKIGARAERPLYGIMGSAVPWIWMIETGAGLWQVPISVAESGPIAAKIVVRQASA